MPNRDAHNRAVELERRIKNADSVDAAIALLAEALDDDDYGFCMYEGCVANVFELALPYAADGGSLIPGLKAWLADDCLEERELEAILKLLVAIPAAPTELIRELVDWRDFLAKLQNTTDDDDVAWVRNSMTKRC